jgi:indole-3-glycerol phosphate synthase
MQEPSTFLARIVEQKRVEIAGLYRNFGLNYFKQAAACSKIKQFSFLQNFPLNKLNLIAEVKKASPSKGIIREDFEPVSLAKSFEQLGAAAISVLTEKEFFFGDPAYIAQIKQEVSLPILRKDFIVDPIQVYEAKYIGADAILLIKAILTNELCQELIDLAQELGLAVLLEIHSAEELVQIRSLKNLQLVGVNNRDLSTFKLDITLAARLLPEIRQMFPEVLVIAESGYDCLEQLAELKTAGFNGVLIGEGMKKLGC